jgi:hypothetical protein
MQGNQLAFRLIAKEPIYEKTIFVILTLVVALSLSGFFFWNNSRVQAMSIPINVRDFSEHGLAIISPSDPAFNNKVSSLFRGEQNALIESLKPFSVLLNNTSDKSIVAYQLKWEMVKADGTILIRQTGGG